jgi:DNA-binding MarR family transcriptional regulator
MLHRNSGPVDSPRMGALLRLAWQRVRERIYRGVQDDGYRDLNPAHVSLFRYEGLDGRRPTQLAETMQITKQSINDLLRHLEQQGYLECRPDPDDRRARLVHLTARGRRLDATVRTHAHAAEREFAHELGEESFRELYGMLLKISASRGDAE